MQKSKLLRLINTLSDQEWKDFEKFLVYKLANKSKVTLLYKYIKRYRKNLASNKFDIDEVRASVDLGYISQKNLQNLMSKLSIILEEYLIVNSILKDENEMNTRVFELYNQRNLYGLANKKAQNIVDNWNKSKVLDIDLYRYLLRILHTQYFSENPIKYKKGNSVLKNLIVTLNNFHLVLLKYYEFVLDSAVSINLIENKEISNYAFSNDLSMGLITIISNLKDLNNIRDTEKEKAFDYLYDALLKKSSISSEIITIVYGLCERYLIQMISKGNDKKYMVKLFELYNVGIKKGFVLYNNALSTMKFQTIIKTACLLEKFDWARQFISDYKNLVPKLEREENMEFAKIQILFGKMKYDEMITKINSLNFSLFTFKLQSRWYLLACYFITYDDFNFIDAQINSFTQFCYYNKKRISKINFDGSLNLAKILNNAISRNKGFNLEEEIKKYEDITLKNRLESFFHQRDLYIKKHNIKV